MQPLPPRRAELEGAGAHPVSCTVPLALNTSREEGHPTGQRGRLLAHALPLSPPPFEAATGEEGEAYPGTCCSPSPRGNLSPWGGKRVWGWRRLGTWDGWAAALPKVTPLVLSCGDLVGQRVALGNCPWSWCHASTKHPNITSAPQPSWQPGVLRPPLHPPYPQGRWEEEQSRNCLLQPLTFKAHALPLFCG